MIENRVGSPHKDSADRASLFFRRAGISRFNMSLPDQTPKLPKIPFLVGDVVLLGAAWYIAQRDPGPLSVQAIAAITGCSGSRSTARTSISSRDSGCRVTSTSSRARWWFPICRGV